MKTYQSVTSLATSPAISSNSLYSNGFFVTLTPPPPSAQLSNNHSKNSSTTADPPALSEMPSTEIISIVNQNLVNCTHSSLKYNDHNYFDEHDTQSKHQRSISYTAEQQKEHNDIQTLINNYDEKKILSKTHDHSDGISANEDELSVENTRL